MGAIKAVDELNIDAAGLSYDNTTDKLTVAGILHTNGGRNKAITHIIGAVCTGDSYTAKDSDNIIIINTNDCDVTLDLPAGVAGTEYIIINSGYGCDYAIEITPNGSEKLFGSAAATNIGFNGYAHIFYDATDGWVGYYYPVEV
jgi:hypothetical protein